MLLLMLLMRRAEVLLLPGTSTIMPHCNPKCQSSQTCQGKRQQASKAHACFNSCFALGNTKHSTRRMVGSCGTTHLAFFQSLSSTSPTAISPEADLTCHSKGSGNQGSSNLLCTNLRVFYLPIFGHPNSPLLSLFYFHVLSAATGLVSGFIPWIIECYRSLLQTTPGHHCERLL